MLKDNTCIIPITQTYLELHVGFESDGFLSMPESIKNIRLLALQMAEVLFFVIDSKTRAISSMIEVVYLIGEYCFV